MTDLFKRRAGAMSPGLFLFLLLFAGALTLGLASGQQVGAEEPPKPGAAEEEELDDPDLGDKNLPFSKQINRALDEGVNWLLGKPEIFDMGNDVEAAWWGLTRGTKIYGGGSGPTYKNPAGPTALALYTLLKCEVDPDHPIIERGFNWLRERHRITQKYDDNAIQGEWRHTEAAGSYELSVMILALTAKYDQYKKSAKSRSAKRRGKLKIRDTDDRKWLMELVERLIARRGQPGPGEKDKEMLGWRYNVPVLQIRVGRTTHTRNVRVPPHSNQDLSSTQLATLALYSASRFGVKIDPQVWVDIIEYSLHNQEEDGPEHERYQPRSRYAAPKDKARGFMYIKGSPDHTEGQATGSMTACGLANILIAKDALENDKKGKKILSKSDIIKRVDRATLDAIAWLDRNWSDFNNPVKNGYHVYYLYSLERAMDILGRNLCGRHVWYPAGAKQLLKRQNRGEYDSYKHTKKRKKLEKEKKPGTFWDTDSTHEPHDVLDTCFALLFLKRATHGLVPTPVITGK